MVIDLDATLVTAHSDKQDATRSWKKGFGFHPLLGFVDHGGPSGGEPVCELLRPGKAGSNTAADHVVVLDTALAQLPRRASRPGRRGRMAVLVRTDAAGATKEFAAHLHEHAVEFSVGASFAHLDVHTALAQLPAAAWTPAYQARKPRAAERGVQIVPRDGPGSPLHRRHRPGPARLVRAARAARHRHRLRTQTTTAAHPRHRRTARAHRPATRAAHRLDLALGRGDHHRAHPTLHAPRSLTRPPHPYNRGPRSTGRPVELSRRSRAPIRQRHNQEDQQNGPKITVRSLRKRRG